MSSEITELEEKLHQAEKLAYVGQMTSKLAHELRNPLNTISINLQMLEEDIKSVKPANPSTQPTPAKLDCDRFLRRIEISRHEIQRLEHLLSNFLRFAKSVPTESYPIDINQLIRNSIEFIMPTANSNKIEIISDLHPNLPLINIDEKLMKSAILNLVLNAIDAMPDGGTLTVKTVLLPKETNQLQIIIQDTGTGIPAANLAKIFDVFYTTKEDGSGLGLPIAKRIIADADGTIEITSVIGKGTIATILFPINNP